MHSHKTEGVRFHTSHLTCHVRPLFRIKGFEGKKEESLFFFVQSNFFVEHERLWLSGEECGAEGVARIIDTTGTITNIIM